MKKIIGLLLSFAMFVSVAFSVSAYTDVKDDSYAFKAITVLSDLAILEGFEDGEFKPEDVVTRAQMAKIITLVQGQGSLANGDCNFVDVANTHWAKGYIGLAASNGIVKGVGNNCFEPEASVKFQDVIVMVMRTLGYERIANRAENGGYPNGYLKIASQRGVLTNVNYDGNTPATREVVAQVIYNALTTPLVDVSYYAPNPEEDEYVIYDGKGAKELRTLLTYTNEIYKVKATVENTAKTKEALRKTEPKVELVITDTYGYDWEDILNNEFSKSKNTIAPYVGEISKIEDYLGYTVEAYIVENLDSNWELVSAVVDSKATDSETVTENFEAYTEGTFEYYKDLDDSRTTKIDLVDEDELSVYYNGSLINDDDIAELGGLENLLVNEANAITFMGPKNDDYNKIFVTDYSYRQVDSIRAADKFVKFTTGSLSFDEEERNNDTFIYNLYDEDGNPITLKDVEEDDLFNIVAPLVDGKKDEFDEVPYIDIWVTRNSVKGMVSEEIDEDTFVINGKKYDSLTTLKVGDEGVFYITIDGLVYTSDATTTASRNYSFIVAYGTDESFGVTTHQLKLFTSDNTLKTYDIASTVKINGKTYKRNDKTQNAYFEVIADLVADADSKESATEKLGDRVVTYRLNSANEIVELKFAGSGASDFNVSYKEGAKYHNDTEVFANWDLDSSSVLFVAPVTEIAEDAWNVDEDDLEIAAFDSFDEDKVGGYDAYIFYFDRDDYLGAALVGDKISNNLKKSHLAVVKTRSIGIDEDGYDVTKYTFVQSGNVVTKAVDYDAKLIEDEAMDIGDVFRYSTNVDNEIDELEVIYDASTRVFDAGKWTYDDYDVNDIAIVYGEITKVEDGKMTLDYGNDIPKLTMNETKGNTYALVDEAKMIGNNPSSAVKALSNAGYIKESYGSYTYYAVAIVGESGRFEDIVQIQEK